ncbi:molybdopterin molybdotransferase MoeA [Shivajiella indica]|uniref:Molybdopterin molybdenumtransferase n=1 Tax=Shivajiella indica TaxID=872115 RepID=A0ABW5B992_9BACT
MISVIQAKNLLQSHFIRGKIQEMPLVESLGLFLAKDIQSPLDIPFFDNSAMDGYAIAWNDTHPIRKLRRETKIRAGEMQGINLEENEAIRIFTGAPVPKGADTIIPQEWVKLEGDHLSFDIEKFVKGSNLRKQGAQNRAGDLIAKKGAAITPGMIGLLASVGIGNIPVFTPPSVGIILTGDELEDVGNPLEFGKVYDANGPVLQSYLYQFGIKHVELAKAVDDPIQLQKTIDAFINKHDILIISGGISVGDFDYVKSGLEKAGVKELFYKVKQKPGKPLFVGQRSNQWIFALPGNPASTLTCFNQYVKPCLLNWIGKENPWEPLGYFPLDREFRKKQGLTFFLKAKIKDGVLEILPGQESFNLISFGSANCIAEVHEDVEHLSAGTKIPVYSW